MDVRLGAELFCIHYVTKPLFQISDNKPYIVMKPTRVVGDLQTLI